MNPPYDETFEEFARRNGLDEFFNDYSTEVRGKLLSKNLEKPKDIYDVLYLQVREDSLSKNVPITSKLDENTEEIRNSLLSKQVYNQIDLEESGESYRKSSIAKNKLLSSSKNLEDLGEESRKSALYKNKTINNLFDESNNLEEFSKSSRFSNLSKNDSLKSNDLSEDSVNYRDSSLSKNVENKSDSNLDNEDFRNNNISKNNTKKENLEDISKSFRNNNESNNNKNDSDLLNDSNVSRRENVNSNISKEQNIENSSSDFRDNNISKNETINDLNGDLNIISDVNRDNNLSKNTKKDSNLDIDSSNYRSNSLSKNAEIFNNLEDSSPENRQSNLSKNNVLKEDLEELSRVFRGDSIAKNENENSDLFSTSSVFRSDSLSQNKIKNTNLESLANDFRSISLSNNDTKLNDIEEGSSDFRQVNLSNNKNKISDLENQSINTRQSNLSNNEKKNSDLENDSRGYRSDDLSNNKPSLTDLESDSTPTRNDNLSNNENINSDLELDSTPVRGDNLDANVPNSSNLELDSGLIRDDNLDANVPNSSDLESDSNSFFNNNIANNVSINSDLENDSLPFLGTNVSNNLPIGVNLETDSINFRNDNLSSNISSPFDLGAESVLFRNDNINSNIPNTQDLSEISNNFLNENASNNVENLTDLSNLSNIFRNDQLSKNTSRFSLGSNIILANTSFFVGISNLEVQGAIFRGINNAFNLGKRGLKPLFDDDESIRFFDSISADKSLDYYSTQGQAFPGGRENLLKRNEELLDKKVIVGKSLRESFGISLIDDTSGPDNGFKQFTKPQNKGELQDVIALYNVEQNTFQYSPRRIYEFNPNGGQFFDELTNFGVDSDFQKLLSYTQLEKRRQFFTNTTPSEIINANNGLYLSDDADKLLKTEDGELGSGLSMAAQSDTTDTISLDFDSFGSRKRGVQHVIDSIVSDDRITFSKNFESQGNKDETSIFITGKNKDGSLKKSYNRYSIKNPYAPEEALSIDFNITNYSISGPSKFMVFPAYIKSFQHGDSASWNSTTFLGRPEPIYTYGNSSRDGSISFFVLTDYATTVDLGYEFIPNTGEVKKVKFESDDKNFFNTKNNVSRTKSNAKADVADLRSQLNSQDLTNEERSEIESEILRIETQIGSLEEEERKTKSNESYSENLPNGNNLYKFIESFQEVDKDGGFTESKAENTAAKLAEMKRNIQFQPSYFSGSKVDFLERMEFISKLTRPSRNKTTGDSGFSFTKAPVSHLRLGDWFNHDIVVNSVSYDYADAPWTLDGGKVYPMWCNVTINFNIIGTFGAEVNEDTPLSTDVGGFMGRKRIRT